MGCTSSKGYDEQYDEHGRAQVSPKADKRRRKEMARAEKLRQRLPSPVVQGDDLPPWVARPREVYTPPLPEQPGYRSYGATDDRNHSAPSEKQSSQYYR